MPKSNAYAVSIITVESHIVYALGTHSALDGITNHLELNIPALVQGATTCYGTSYIHAVTSNFKGLMESGSYVLLNKKAGIRVYKETVESSKNSRRIILITKLKF